jgi:hypothetical protein
MKHAKYLAIAIAFLSLAASCKNEEPEPTNKGNLVLKFDLYNGASPMDWDDVISISDVNEYRMEFFKFYLSNLYAVKTDGSKIKLSDVIIVDASKSEGVTFSYNIPNGSYDKVEWGVGLDAVLNASDPVQFEATHPLSASQAMYWSWATKYRFVRIDAKGNKDGTLGSPSDLLLAYHPGADEFYGVIELVKPFSIAEAANTNFTVKLDMAALFDGPGGKITISTEPQTHTEPSDYHIAEKFMLNMMVAFTPM